MYCTRRDLLSSPPMGMGPSSDCTLFVSSSQKVKPTSVLHFGQEKYRLKHTNSGMKSFCHFEKEVEKGVEQVSTQESSVETTEKKNGFSFRLSLWACSNRAPRGNWETRGFANCRRNLHRTMLDSNKSEGLRRRSRHGEAKSSSVAVSATELARLVCLENARFALSDEHKCAAEPCCVVWRNGQTWPHQHFEPNERTNAATHDAEKTTVTVYKPWCLDFSAQNTWFGDHPDAAFTAQRACRGRVRF